MPLMIYNYSLRTRYVSDFLHEPCQSCNYHCSEFYCNWRASLGGVALEKHWLWASLSHLNKIICLKFTINDFITRHFFHDKKYKPIILQVKCSENETHIMAEEKGIIVKERSIMYVRTRFLYFFWGGVRSRIWGVGELGETSPGEKRGRDKKKNPPDGSKCIKCKKTLIQINKKESELLLLYLSFIKV